MLEKVVVVVVVSQEWATNKSDLGKKEAVEKVETKEPSKRNVEECE